MKKITIIDGQGGKIGKIIVEQLKKAHPEQEIYAIGASKAYKILISTNKCNHYIAGCVDLGLAENIRIVCEKVEQLIKE